MSFIRLVTPEGYPLDLDGNTRLTFENKSPVLSFDVIPGEKTHPFILPSSPRNKRYLNYPHEIGNVNTQYTRLQGYSLYLGGNFYALGDLYVKKSNKKGIEVSFQTAASRIAKFKDSLITDFNLGAFEFIPFGFNTTFIDINNGTADDYDFCLGSYYNKAIYDDAGEYPNSGPFGWFGVEGWVSSFLSPQLYLKTVIRAFENENILNIRHKGNFLEDEELKSLVMFSPTAWFTIASPIDMFYTDMLPDITFKDFYNGLASMFCLSFLFSRRTNDVTIKSFNEIIQNTDYLDITRYTSPNYDDEFFDEKGVALKMTPDSADSLAADSDDFYFGNTPFNEVKSSLSSVDSLTRNHIGPDTDSDHRLPAVDMSFNPQAGKPSFGPRLLFYRGMQDDSNSTADPDNFFKYPYLSRDDKAWNNVTIPGTNYTLDYNGDKGLYNVWWKNFLDFKTRSKNVILSSRLPIGNILDFDFSQPILNKSQLFLPAEHEWSADTRGLSDSTIEAYHIP